MIFSNKFAMLLVFMVPCGWLFAEENPEKDPILEKLIMEGGVLKDRLQYLQYSVEIEKEFSVLGSKDKDIRKIKFYRDGEKWREETTYDNGAQEIIIATSESAKYRLIPAKKCYEQIYPAGALSETINSLEKKDSEKHSVYVATIERHNKYTTPNEIRTATYYVGKDIEVVNLNGEECFKYEGTVEIHHERLANDKRPQNETSAFIYYISKATKSCVRIVNKNENTQRVTNYRNFNPAPPDSSLFKVPSDYKST